MGTDLTTYRGDDYTLTLTFEDADAVAMDISGWTVFFTLKRNVSDADNDAVHKLDITSHTTAVSGITSVYLARSITENLAGAYAYDIQYKDDSDNVKTVMTGNMIFTEDVTIRDS